MSAVDVVDIPLVPTGADGVPATLQQLVGFTDAWLDNRRLSSNTRQAYRRDVVAWLSWCAEPVDGAAGPVRLDPMAARFTHVNTYARTLESTVDPRTGRAYGPATVARKLAAVSSWYTFLVNLGALPRNPVDGADRPKVDRYHSVTVSPAEREAAAIVAAADRDPYPAALRTRALIRFLLGLGARVTDAGRTRLADLGTAGEHRTVVLHMKGGRTRRRRLPDQLAAAIGAMLAERAALAGVPVGQLDPAAPLFATASGRPIDRREVGYW